MSKLLSLQEDFLAVIKSDNPVDRVPIFEANGVLKETRIGIYRHAYWSRITDSLSADFTRTDMLLTNWPFSFEDLVHDFMTEEKNNFPSLGELSRAFFVYVISTNQRMNQLPIWEINRFVKTLRTDYACLMCSLSPWSLLFSELAPNVLGVDELTARLATDTSVGVVWNSSLQIFDTVLVFQKNRDVTLLDVAEVATGGAHGTGEGAAAVIANAPGADFLPAINGDVSALFELLDMRRNIASFDQLIDEMARLEFDEATAQSTIQFLVGNEILFFVPRDQEIARP